MCVILSLDYCLNKYCRHGSYEKLWFSKEWSKKKIIIKKPWQNEDTVYSTGQNHSSIPIFKKVMMATQSMLGRGRLIIYHWWIAEALRNCLFLKILQFIDFRSEWQIRVSQRISIRVHPPYVNLYYTFQICQTFLILVLFACLLEPSLSRQWS